MNSRVNSRVNGIKEGGKRALNPRVNSRVNGWKGSGEVDIEELGTNGE